MQEPHSSGKDDDDDTHVFRDQSQIFLPGFHSNPEVLKFISTNKVTFWLYDDGKAWHC